MELTTNERKTLKNILHKWQAVIERARPVAQAHVVADMKSNIMLSIDQTINS